MILQHQLHELQVLNRQIAQLSERQNELRERLLVQLDRGEPIEDGRLIAYKQVSHQRRFSFGSVSGVLGEGAASQLRDQLAPVACVRLVICNHDQDVPPADHS